MNCSRLTKAIASLKFAAIAPNSDIFAQTCIRVHLVRMPFEVTGRYGTQTDLYESTGHKNWLYSSWFREISCRRMLKTNDSVPEHFLGQHLKLLNVGTVFAEVATALHPGDFLQFAAPVFWPLHHD